MTSSAHAAAPPVAFCGECGAALEAGLKFCGECGTPVMPDGPPAQASPVRNTAQPTTPVGSSQQPAPPAARTSPPPNSAQSAAELRWAPPPPGAPSNTATPARKFCAKCGTPLKPGSRFCRKCGRDSQAPLTKAQGNKPTAERPAAAATKGARPPAPTRSPKADPIPNRASAPQTPAKAPSQLFKKTLRVIVPVGSMVATYFLTNKVLGPLLAQRFGDASRQMVPMLVSMAVGGVARQITK